MACVQGASDLRPGFALKKGDSSVRLGRMPMTMILNDLLTPRKIKVALLVLATFAAMC
jgi:hypothetical protein